MECYYKYNIDITQILNLDYIYKKANEHSDKGMILVISSIALRPKFFKYLKQYGLRDYLMLFLRKANNLKEGIHTDYATEEQPHHYSLNIICKGQGIMTWFQRPAEGSQMFRHPTDPNGIIYETYNSLALESIDQWADGKIALVRTGIPHGVINDSFEDRICLSIRIDNYGWEQAKEIYNNFFQSYINDQN
jgi:hypothetical protein